MPRTHHSLQPLTQGLRDVGPALLKGVPQPHEELLALVWGPRFDREHALGLTAHQPEKAARTLPALLSAADCFDALAPESQRRVRSLILRHHRLAKSA
ncbi:MAG: hypothetical protein ACTS8S_16440 [Giesbergeria sp.]